MALKLVQGVAAGENGRRFLHTFIALFITTTVILASQRRNGSQVLLSPLITAILNPSYIPRALPQRGT